MMKTPACGAVLLALALCAACSAVSGRTVLDASGDLAADVSDAAEVSDAAADAGLPDGVGRDGAGRDGASTRCPRGESPAVDARLSGVVIEAAPSSLATAAVRSALVDAQGRIYAIGYRETAPGSRRNAASVWRFVASGLRVDETYGDHGLATDREFPANNAFWLTGAFDEAGRVLVAGFDGDDATGSTLVGRFTVDGRADVTFGASGRTLIPAGVLTRSSDAVRPFGMLHDAQGTLLAGGDGPPWNRPSSRGFAVRLRPDGVLDGTFGASGLYGDSGLHGCFDVMRDGDEYVLACISEDDRPALLRLDASGARVHGFAQNGLSVHMTAPRGFQARALRRDSSGRWLIAGSVSSFYDDQSNSPSAVRFLADGAPDPTYGDRGVAVALGVRQTFAYAYGQAFRVTCDDRLMFGASSGTFPLVGGFDREGHRIENFGEDGYLRMPARAGVYGSISALLALPSSADLVVVGSINIPGLTLGRVLQ